MCIHMSYSVLLVVAHFESVTVQLLHCNALQRTATQCCTMQHTATHCNTLQYISTHYNMPQYNSTRCNTLQHAATHCSMLAHIGGVTVQFSTPTPFQHCNKLKFTATQYLFNFLFNHRSGQISISASFVARKKAR